MIDACENPERHREHLEHRLLDRHRRGRDLRPAGWILAAVCGVVGYTVGYIVTDAVYNYFDWGQCGLEIGLNYDLSVDYIDYWDGTNC